MNRILLIIVNLYQTLNLFYSLSGAQRFDFPATDENKFGNRSQSVDFIWRYSTPDITQTSITCVVGKVNIVFKARNTAAAIQGIFTSRATAIEESTASPYSIGFTLRNLDFSDANDYVCTMSYASNPPVYSSTYKFGIYGKYCVLATEALFILLLLVLCFFGD